MKKKEIKFLALASFKENSLDEKKVLGIAEKLNREDLKQYIKYLRAEEKKRTVYIESAMPIKDISEFKNMFPEKKVIVKHVPSLLAGIRIIANDDITDMNLQSSLHAIIKHIEN